MEGHLNTCCSTVSGSRTESLEELHGLVFFKCAVFKWQEYFLEPTPQNPFQSIAAYLL